jgi:hypothetical protein
MRFKSNIIGGKHILLRVVFLSSLCWLNVAGAIQSAQIAPPDVKLVDEFGVNIATGQVNVSQETVSIGGERGLSHSISMETNHFAQNRMYGYHDKYAGAARYTRIWEDHNLGSRLSYAGGQYAIFSVIRVHGPVGSQDFVMRDSSDGTLQPDPLTVDGLDVSDLVFEAMGDTRHTLERSADGQYLVWTTPNGTESYYVTGALTGSLRKIIYPNGFTLKIESLGGVMTNTGFQLKYDYFPHNSSWAGRNPGRVIAVNNAVEYCPPDELYASQNCDFEHDWPMARFEWPAGMPETFFSPEDESSKFTVTDGNGDTTKYYYKPYDLALDGDTVPAGSHWEEGEKWSPRLVAIESANSNVKDRKYTYENDWGTGMAQMWLLESEAGKVKRAIGPRGERGGYSFFENLANPGGKDYLNTGGINSVETIGSRPGAIRKARFFTQGTFTYEENFRNFVKEYSPETNVGTSGPELPGPRKTYHYDDRGNLEKIVMTDIFDSSKPATTIKAGYPDTCDNPKTCNKPEWVEDAKGNRTNYTYETNAQGFVIRKTVTGPPDAGGVRPQTRYRYAPYYAYYKKDGDSVEKADSPLWLLEREAYCRTSAASGEGCAAGPEDEVVTEYDYGPQDGSANNLHLRGVSVTAAGDDGELETRTTCYEYDIYGHRIGETEAKGMPAGACR